MLELFSLQATAVDKCETALPIQPILMFSIAIDADYSNEVKNIEI